MTTQPAAPRPEVDGVPDGSDLPAYTAAGPARPTADELRERIPGWGVDLDPADRPSYPKLDLSGADTGAHWRFPDLQDAEGYRERSVEHRFLTPVFGTAQPLRGLSGRIRRLAYDRFSEGRNAHWLLLIAADRVDVVEGTLGALLRARPDNPIAESGVAAELHGHPVASRRGRSDWRHQPLDAVIVLGPWALAAAGAVAVVRRVLR